MNVSRETLLPMQKLALDVCARHGITEAALRGQCRKKRFYLARVEYAKRAVAMGKSQASIARYLHKDHTSIRYYLGKVKRS